jgi:hypothetical protein
MSFFFLGFFHLPPCHLFSLERLYVVTDYTTIDIIINFFIFLFKSEKKKKKKKNLSGS